MQYKQFQPDQEKEVNDFLAANKKYIHENGFYVFPDRIVFLVSDEFDASLTAYNYRRTEYLKQLGAVHAQIADNLVRRRVFENLDPEETVGEKTIVDTGGPMGKSKVAVTAAEGIKEIDADLLALEQKQEAIEKLLGDQ